MNHTTLIDEFHYIKVIMIFVLGLSWLISTRLLVRYFKSENKKYTWLMLIPIVFLIIYYFYLPNNSTDFQNETIPIRYALYFITGHLTIFFSPFIFTWNKISYWNYLKIIFNSFAKSILFSLVIYLGLTLALVALEYLFQFEVEGERYLELFIYCLGIINTWLFVADLPKDIHKKEGVNYPKALLVFVKYILIPLTILYLIILYAYSIKILINWNLPKGWVSYLVIALSILGFIIHILINPIRKTTNSKIIKNFYPWFYYALLPMLTLLFAAIYKRITDYGFTENRYLLLIVSLWIVGMSLYILFSKQKKLIYFPMSIALLSIMIYFGFWGVFSVSKNSQIKRYKKVYASIKAEGFKVKYTEKSELQSITRYLVKRNAIDKVSDVLGYKPTNVLKT